MKTFEDILNEMARRIERKLEFQYDDEPEELENLVYAWFNYGGSEKLFDDIKEAFEYVRADEDLYFDNYDDAIAFLKTLTLPIDKCVDIMLDNNYEPDEINTINLANVLAEYRASACFYILLPNNKENLAHLVAKNLACEYGIISHL